MATLNAKYIHSSLALRCLKSSCRQACSELAVREYTINNEPLQVLGDIYRAAPDVLGLACYIWNVGATLDLAAMVKKVLPDTVVVLGGPEVTYGAGDVLAANPAVDYVIQGEGEAALAALLTALERGQGAQEVAGVAFRRGETVVEGTPQVSGDLNALPFAYSQADMAELAGKIIYYESSRGCPYSCQYCLSGAAGGVRFLDVERVKRELDFFIANGVRQVKFVDRTFNARREHYLPILEFLAAKDCATNFHFEIAADILDSEVLAFLRQVPPGRFQFEIGVQSTHPPTLAAISRHNDWPRIVAAVGELRAAGNSHLHLDLIAGLPYEDFERFGKSFNDVYSLRPHMLQLGFLKLLKGSGLRRREREHGYVFMDGAPYEVLANRYISYGEIRRLKILEEMFGQLYNSGRFAATLDWLVGMRGGDAFGLYSELAAYWEERDLHLAAHSAKGLFGHLAGFCRAKWPEQAALWSDLLKYDALAREGGTVRPEFLNWNGDAWQAEKNAFWRDEETVRRYLPGFVFTTWRELKKRYHLEVFAHDIPGFADNGGELARARTAVLFSYAGAGRTGVQRLAAGDFWREGER